MPLPCGRRYRHVSSSRRADHCYLLPPSSTAQAGRGGSAHVPCTLFLVRRAPLEGPCYKRKPLAWIRRAWHAASAVQSHACAGSEVGCCWSLWNAVIQGTFSGRSKECFVVVSLSKLSGLELLTSDGLRWVLFRRVVMVPLEPSYSAQPLSGRR